MRLLRQDGLWRTDDVVEGPPLVAVLEVGGAVLEWTVDAGDGGAAPSMTFTDPGRADWLWQAVGVRGHVALLAALGRSDPAEPMIEVPGVRPDPAVFAPVRRLALGHWLLRWWPASRLDGIAALDPALLAAEIAVLTVAAEQFFTGETLDSDLAPLLVAHTPALVRHLGGTDSRVRDIAGAALAIADDVGVGPPPPPVPAAARSRDDYALVAGGGAPTAAAIVRGAGSLSWSRVPAGMFDAAENTVRWRIDAAAGAVTGTVEVALQEAGDAAGVAVRLSSGGLVAAGVLDSTGRAVLPLHDGQRPAGEAAAWNHDWSRTVVTVGAPAAAPTETPEARSRVRTFARARLARPTESSFLAERLATESLY